MVSILIGCLGFIITHTFDFVALKRVKKLKPVVWFTGFGLIGYSLIDLFLKEPKILLPIWLNVIGWIFMPVGLLLQLFPIFINLPFKDTYIKHGINTHLITNGFYSLTRHPGVMGFTILLPSLFFASGSKLLLIAVPIFYFFDLLVVWIQDVYFFPKMFPEYNEYRKLTPIFYPNKRSIKAFINNLRSYKGGQNNDFSTGTV